MLLMSHATKIFFIHYPSPFNFSARHYHVASYVGLYQACESQVLSDRNLHI